MAAEQAQPMHVHDGTVRREWIDGSGHMYAAYYVVAFGEANDAVLDLLGLGDDYRRSTKSAPFLLEMHTTYLREMVADAPFKVSFQLLEFDARRLRYFLRMTHGDEGHLVATVETAVIHVDLATRKSSNLPGAVMDKLEEIRESQQGLEFPPQAGRGISLS